MCSLALGFPVKNEIAPIAIPMTARSGRITPVIRVFSPKRLSSSPAFAKAGVRTMIAEINDPIKIFIFNFHSVYFVLV
jgi:hypothetical protein